MLSGACLCATVLGVTPGEGVGLSGLKLVFATLTVGVIPGPLCLLLWRFRRACPSWKR